MCVWGVGTRWWMCVHGEVDTHVSYEGTRV